MQKVDYDDMTIEFVLITLLLCFFWYSQKEILKVSCLFKNLIKII